MLKINFLKVDTSLKKNNPNIAYNTLLTDAVPFTGQRNLLGMGFKTEDRFIILFLINCVGLKNGMFYQKTTHRFLDELFYISVFSLLSSARF